MLMEQRRSLVIGSVAAIVVVVSGFAVSRWGGLTGQTSGTGFCCITQGQACAGNYTAAQCGAAGGTAYVQQAQGGESPQVACNRACNAPGSTVVCGDSNRQGAEECDDGNTTNGDGCSSICKTEQGWRCVAPDSAGGAIACVAYDVALTGLTPPSGWNTALTLYGDCFAPGEALPLPAGSPSCAQTGVTYMNCNSVPVSNGNTTPINLRTKKFALGAPDCPMGSQSVVLNVQVNYTNADMVQAGPMKFIAPYSTQCTIQGAGGSAGNLNPTVMTYDASADVLYIATHNSQTVRPTIIRVGNSLNRSTTPNL